MQTYTHYKDSGIDWIGQIPEHWQLIPNKFIFRLKKNQVGKRSSEYDLLSLTLRGIIKRDMENPEGKFPADFDTYQEVKVNDFVFCLFDVEETPRTIGLSAYDGMITGAYTVMEPIGEDFALYLYYYYLNADDKKQLKFLYRGLRNTIPKDSFFSLKTAIPSIHEQEAIANFLDEKTAKIDALVQTKEQQIEKLKELRQAKIHQAVSKGIPCHAELVEASSKTHALSKVEMKDSGVEWIGEIPAHWEVRRLATLGNFSKGGGFSKADLVEENGVSAILYGDIYTKYNYIIKESVRLISNTAASNAIVLEFDDLLFTGSGETKEDIGKCVAFKSKTITVAGGDVIIFKQISNSSNYLSYCLNTEGAKFEKAKSSKGEIIVHTYASKLKEISVPIPPIQEQEQIVAYLDDVTGKIDQAIAQKQEQITKLKEYKQSLINDVVTGKVKVC